MKTDELTVSELEMLWSALSEGIDTAGEANEVKYLAKAFILLANRLGDIDAVLECLGTAQTDL